MSLNPLNELKRRLEDDSTPLPKRLCLAKNMVTSHHFPTAPKERIIADWLEELTRENKLTSVELQKVLEWASFDDLTGELKSRLVRVVSLFVQKNILHQNDIKFIISFLENPKISQQQCQQIEDCFNITVTLLQFLKNDDNNNSANSERLLNNLLRYYKESKKKLEFITKFLLGETLETVFSYLDTDCRNTVINICQSILFPQYKRTYFISYLQTLIRKDNIEELIQEKGDNIQSVLKIMNIFFKFPEHRTEKDPKFLENFIDVFVSCFKKEYQIVFAFYIMAANVLTMKQDYIIPSINMEPIIFEQNGEKIKRNLFLNMLEIVLKNEVDIAVRLTDNFGYKIPRIETKKTFMSFLQAVMMGQIKLKGKIDKTTLQIIKTALKLDPILIEQKMDEILPPIMASKKNTNVSEAYKDMLNCLLEILFKLSRGTQFWTQILPLLKLNLETCNTEQLKLEQETKEVEQNGGNSEKLRNKLLTGNDVFPQECVDTFGRLTMDLMFRQNKDLLETMQKDLEDHCLVLLEQGFVGPSTTVLTSVLSSILSSFLQHSKMADHTVPQNIAEEFWTVYGKFEDCLRRLGLCTLKVNNTTLLKSFLRICLSYSQLKLLNIKYSNCKIQVPAITDGEFNLSVILPCLNDGEWEQINGLVDEDSIALMDQLRLVKTMISQIISINQEIDYPSDQTKSQLVKQLNSNSTILETEKYFPKVLFSNLDLNQYKQLAKGLVKLYLNDEAKEIFDDVAITNNRPILNALVLEVSKNITKSMENCEALSKALNKSEFNIGDFAKERNMQEYFSNLNINVAENQDDKIKKCIELLKSLKIAYLDENYQVTAIFVMLALKKCCQTKKIKRNIDCVLQNIFELSLHSPDLYMIFPVNAIFDFDDTTIMDLLTLKIKTSNPLLLIKCVVEKAVKRVRIDSDLLNNLINILISKKLHKNKSIEAFSDPAFQITCLVLPLIVKQKQATRLSAMRSILNDLLEKLYKILLQTFKNINFAENGSLFSKTGNTEDSVEDSDTNMTALNAIAAYTLTLSKYCETNDVEEIQKLDCLWSGLEFFTQNAIQTLSNPESKPHHIESSIHLLNVTLRYIKKLNTHPIFETKDKIYIEIWNAINTRLLIIFGNDGNSNKDVKKNQDGGRNCQYLVELGITLQFICELVSVEGFDKFLSDLGKLVVLKKPFEIIKDEDKTDLTNHKVSKYIWNQCLKANTVGPKCSNMTKIMYQNSRNLKSWIRHHYDTVQNVASRKRKLDVYSEEKEVRVVKVPDDVCNILRVDLDILSEVIFAGKKITLDYKYLDVIFELLHMVQHILGSSSIEIRCEVTWQAYFNVFEGCVAILNSLLVSREELLEDRWPNYMQCYRVLAVSLCERPSIDGRAERALDDKLAEAAHSVDKLSQAISKRKKQVSRIAAYTVADLCTALEKNAPSRKIRLHLENSIASLIQASDSTYAMAFLKRALAGSVGQMTMSNLYNVYKKYHKYTGNS